MSLGLQTAANGLKCLVASQSPKIIANQCRSFFPYLRIAFNQVDLERLATVGPDRLCAEWYVDNLAAS